MPKYYCDYCDIHLTHDSRRVRRDHNSGWRHKMHLQNYYAGLEAYKVQSVINNITKAYVYAGLGGFPELPTAGQKQLKALPRMPGFPPGFVQPAAGMIPPPGMTMLPGMPMMPPGMMFPPPGMSMMQPGAVPPPPPPRKDN